MLTISNFLSLLRAPLAFLFFLTNPWVRVSAVVLAMITDGLDGYLARRYRSVSHFGTVLDPLMDKFFAIVVFAILVSEGTLSIWAMAIMLARDFGLGIFGAYVTFFGDWSSYKVEALRFSKISTVLQFFVMVALSLGYQLPFMVYGCFIVLAVLSSIELILSHRRSIQDKKGEKR